MNERERIVAVAAAALVGLLVVGYAGYWYMGALETRERKLESVQSDVKKKKAEQQAAQAAAKRLADYENRSLPPDAETAKSRYEQWLIHTAQETKLSDVKITSTAPTPVKNTYSRLSFTVNAQGELPQLVDFLYRFQRLAWMHRIESLKLIPLNNEPRKINANFTITALSVKSAPRTEELVEQVSEKFKDAKLADYSLPILNRNFFSAPNRKPEIDVASRQDAVIDRSYELTLKAKDPESDQISWSLVKGADPAAKLDPKSGKLSWRPKSKGEFAFEVVAQDNGLPSRSSEPKTIYITVKDPPPPPMRTVDVPKKPVFDEAKYTVLTAVIENTGASEIWLHNRAKGETRVLQVNDKFAIGSVKGEVVEIGVDDVILNVDGKLRRFVVGQTLAVSEGSD